MKRSFVIDVGSSKVSFLDASAEGGALIINSFDTRPYAGYSIGKLPDAEAVLEAVDELLSKAYSRSVLRSHSICIGVPAPFILSAVTSREVRTPSGRVCDSDLELLLDRGENIEPPEGYTLMHTTPFDYAVNELACGGSSPLGLKSKRLSAKFCHAFVCGEFVSLLTDAVESAGWSVGNFISSPMACASFTIPLNARLGGAVLIDCGGTHCDVSAIRGNAVVRTESFGIGGTHFAKDIAYGFELPMQEAEELKRGYRFGGEAALAAAKDLNADDLRLIVESRAEEFADRLREALDAVSSEIPAGSPVHLVGGGVSGMSGCIEYLSEKTARSIIAGAPRAGRLNGIRHSPTLALAHFMLYDGGMPEKSALSARSTDRIFSGVKEFFSVSAFTRKHKI